MAYDPRFKVQNPDVLKAIQNVAVDYGKPREAAAEVPAVPAVEFVPAVAEIKFVGDVPEKTTLAVGDDVYEFLLEASDVTSEGNIKVVIAANPEPAKDAAAAFLAATVDGETLHIAYEYDDGSDTDLLVKSLPELKKADANQTTLLSSDVAITADANLAGGVDYVPGTPAIPAVEAEAGMVGKLKFDDTKLYIHAGDGVWKSIAFD